LVLNF